MSLDAAGLPEVRGPWDRARSEEFLRGARIPIRLATVDSEGPFVQSLWFEYCDGVLWCATQASAVVVRRLQADARCAFEVGGDEPPYRGVRGRATAQVVPEAAADVLPRLIERYLGSGSASLRRWLLGRLETEVALRITPTSMTSWDFSARMA